jgi:hypothetical protein
MTALAELRLLEETATHGKPTRAENMFAHSSIVTMAMGNKDVLAVTHDCQHGAQN